MMEEVFLYLIAIFGMKTELRLFGRGAFLLLSQI